MPRYDKFADAESALCPFFVSESRERKSITCEGFEEGIKTSLVFKSLFVKDDYFRSFCADAKACASCVVYCATMENKYSDPK